MTVDKFVLFTTLISIFSESLVFKAGVDLKFFYLVVIANFFLISVTNRVVVNRWHFTWLVLLFVVGVFKAGFDFAGVIFQIAGISCVSVYYYNFYKAQRLHVHGIFDLYASFAFWLAVIGIFLYVVNISIGHYQRLESVLNEPAHYSAIVLPAMYYYWKTHKVSDFRFVTIFISILLASSSVGFLGILFAFLLSVKFRLRNLMLGCLTLCLFSFSVYNYSGAVKMRVNDTFHVLVSSDLTGVNLSTFALMSNFYVTLDSFAESPVFGNGLGSHERSRSKYLGNIEGVEAFEDYYGWNAKDANSLLLRVVSEQGAVGLFLLLWFVIKFGSNLTGTHKIVSKAILIYFFSKLLREGHYFSPEMYFFVMGYFFNYIDNQRKLREVSFGDGFH